MEKIYSAALAKKVSHKRRTSRLLKFIHDNKLASTAITVFLMCLSLNLILIYNFIKILGTI